MSFRSSLGGPRSSRPCLAGTEDAMDLDGVLHQAASIGALCVHRSKLVLVERAVAGSYRSFVRASDSGKFPASQAEEQIFEVDALSLFERHFGESPPCLTAIRYMFSSMLDSKSLHSLSYFRCYTNRCSLVVSQRWLLKSAFFLLAPGPRSDSRMLISLALRFAQPATV